VTAANSSTISDGAASIILASAAAVSRLELSPIARLIGFADAAAAPADFPTAPAKAIPIALRRAGITLDQIDAWEINEAFAVVVLANLKLIGVDAAKVGLCRDCACAPLAFGQIRCDEPQSSFPNTTPHLRSTSTAARSHSATRLVHRVLG
jgi:hypothetical protein